MSLYDGLFTELTTNTTTAGYLAGVGPNSGRVFPLVIPQKKDGSQQVPCVVYSERDVQRQVTYCGTDGLARTVVQIDCYSKTYAEARDLSKAVFDVLQDFQGLLGGIVNVRAASLETQFDVQDFEPGLYRVSQSWVFWHVE